MACHDEDDDGLFDFDIAIAWSSQDGQFFCSPSSIDTWPKPGSPFTCWHPNQRFTLAIEVAQSANSSDPFDVGDNPASGFTTADNIASTHKYKNGNRQTISRHLQNPGQGGGNPGQGGGNPGQGGGPKVRQIPYMK